MSVSALKSIAIAALCAAVLSSCATQGYLSDDFTFDEGDDKAVIVFGVQAKAPIQSVGFIFERLGADGAPVAPFDRGSMSVYNVDENAEFKARIYCQVANNLFRGSKVQAQFGCERGFDQVHYFALTVPSGRYHLSVTDYWNKKGYIIQNIATRLPFSSLKYQFERGKLYYIGDFEMEPQGRFPSNEFLMITGVSENRPAVLEFISAVTDVRDVNPQVKTLPDNVRGQFRFEFRPDQ